MPDIFPKITIEHIIEALQKPLPGKDAQINMLPNGRELIEAGNDPSVITSAVLILIYPENDELFFCLTKRNSNLKHHPGQISFPGGRCELHEKDPSKTALRETEEEIGVPQNQIQLLGKLTEVFVIVSNFNIHPYIGYCAKKPNFIINHKEVEELIELPLHSIFPKENHTERKMETRLGNITVPCYLINEHVIWGATSMMIAELEAILASHYSRREAH